MLGQMLEIHSLSFGHAIAFLTVNAAWERETESLYVSLEKAKEDGIKEEMKNLLIGQ